MNLTVTWEGFEGSIYQVEYRPYPGSDPFTIFSTSITTKYVTIPGLPDGFYEVRVKTDCADGDSAYINKIGGKDACPIVVPGNYTVFTNTDSEQIILINYTNYTPSIKVTIKNINTNTIIQSYSGPGTGVFRAVLPKVAGQTTSYHIEITNVCSSISDNFVTLLDISIQGPPAVINTSFQWLQNFGASSSSNSNCLAPSRSGKPDTGVRAVFSEPLPQAVTIILNYFYTDKGTSVQKDYSVIHHEYISVTIPQGTNTWACAHYRATDVINGSESTCIIRTIPAVLNNGKVLNFTDCTRCTTINNSLPIFNWTQQHDQFNPGHPACRT